MRFLASYLALAYPLVLAVVVGCTSGSDVATTESDGSSKSKGEGASGDVGATPPAGVSETKIYKDADGLRTLIEPFTPPPLAEIEKQVEWEDRPVRSGIDDLKKLQEQEAQANPPPNVEEALRLQNTGPEPNAKIIAALGRLPTDPSQIDWDGGLTHHMRGDVKSTNPILSSSVYDADLLTLAYEGIMTFDWELKPFANASMVQSWQSSKDGMYEKVVMRKDLTWSDGKPVTAHDVAFSFRAIMNPDVPATAVRSGTDQLRWVEAYDDHTIVYFHKEPLATNSWNINFPIIAKHIYEDSIKDDPTLQNSPYHVKYEEKPVVNGPYVIAERQRGQELVLKRRESYYMHDGKEVRHKPYLEEIRMRVIPDPNTALLAFKGGDIDEMELLPEQWVNQTTDQDFYRRNTKTTALEWTYYFFGWNCRSPYFSDRRVREAMSYAFDHQEMLENLLYGLNERCTGNFHPTAPWASKKPKKIYEQDFDKAEELLEQAGWTDSDGDGIRDKIIDGRLRRFEFSIICLNTSERIKICNLLKQNLDQIGVVCNVRPLEFVTLMDISQKHDFDAEFAGWSAGAHPDTSENLWTTPAIDHGRNYVQYSNAYVDGLFELAKQVEGAKERRQQIREKYKLAEVDIQPDASREECYGKIDDLIYADQPYTFLFHRASFYGFNKAIRGYKFSPRGPFHYSPGFFSLWKAK
jgi:peptide/nickel transport system substrate-binding protein